MKKLCISYQRTDGHRKTFYSKGGKILPVLPTAPLHVAQRDALDLRPAGPTSASWTGCLDRADLGRPRQPSPSPRHHAGGPDLLYSEIADQRRSLNKTNNQRHHQNTSPGASAIFRAPPEPNSAAPAHSSDRIQGFF